MWGKRNYKPESAFKVLADWVVLKPVLKFDGDNRSYIYPYLIPVIRRCNLVSNEVDFVTRSRENQWEFWDRASFPAPRQAVIFI